MQVTPSVGPIDDQQKDRAQRILTAAATLFFTCGYERTTTLDIARHANLSKRTLYQCFGNKQGILDALIRTGARRMHQQSDFARPTSAVAFFEALEMFGNVFLQELFSDQKIAMYRLAITDATRSGIVAKQLEESGSMPVIAAVRALFDMARTDSLVRFSDPSVAVIVFFNVLIGEIHLKLIMGTGPKVTPSLIAGRVALALATMRQLACDKRSPPAVEEFTQ